MNVVEAANLQPGEERGEDLAYRCPQHKPDNNPSLLVNEQKDCWLCGPCDEKGNAWALAAFIAGVSPDDKPAVTKWLAEHKLISVKKKQPQKILAVYPYRNLNGDVVFETVRYEPKDFRQRRPDPNGDGYIWNLDGVETIPYRLDEIAKKSAVFLVEGEKDADRLWECGLAASTSPQGAGKWRERYNVYFKGKTVVILPDADEPGKSHAQDVARQLVPVAESVRIIELPGLSRKGDVSDWLDAGHTKEELRALVKATPALKAEGIPPIESTAVTLTDVEKLFEELRLKASELLRNGAEPLQVEMARASLTKFLEGRHLKSLGVTSPAKLVDAAIAQCRQNTVTSESVVEDTIPWDEPVDGSALLQELASRFTRHLVLPAGASTALALWTVHTHALEAAHHTPTLALLSPERRCGKTTALDTLSGLVNRSLATSNVSPAALFRSIEKF
jgi:hypothetical protein